MAYVYELIDPRTNIPFYVGKGTGKRAESHLKESKDQTTNLRKWYKIQSIREDGFEPIINRVKDGLTHDEAYVFEEALIKQYGRKDFDENGILFNICSNNRPPPMTGKTHNKETRAKQSATHTGVKKTPEHCVNIGKAKSGEKHPFWGKPVSDERREKIRQGNLGVLRSDVTRKRMSKAKSGKSITGLVDWSKVSHIRQLFNEGKSRRELREIFPELSSSTINDIVAYRTWSK